MNDGLTKFQRKKLRSLIDVADTLRGAMWSLADRARAQREQLAEMRRLDNPERKKVAQARAYADNAVLTLGFPEQRRREYLEAAQNHEANIAAEEHELEAAILVMEQRIDALRADSTLAEEVVQALLRKTGLDRERLTPVMRTPMTAGAA